MKIQKGLIIGVIGALLVGATEAAGEAGLSALQSDEDSAFTLTVPGGKIGDQALYATFHRTDPNAQWARGPDHGLKIDSVGREIDKFGVERDVVRILYPSEDASSGGLMALEYGFSGSSETIAFTDLASRDAMGWVWQNDWETRDYFVAQRTATSAVGFYGPYDSPSTAFGATQNLRFQEILSMGRAYRVGESIQTEAIEYMASESILYDGYGLWVTVVGPVVPSNATVEGLVAGAGRIDDVEAVDLRFSGCISFDTEGDWWGLEQPNRMPFLGQTIPVPSNVCFSVDRWFSASRPFPLLIETRLTVNGTQTLDHISSMAAFQEGDVPVSWQSPEEAVPYLPNLMANDELERSPAGQTYPSDGTNVRYGYRLADALSSIANDPSLLEYGLWKAQHEKASLVGAHLSPTGADLSGREWLLVFGEGTSGFVLVSARAGPGAVAVNQEYGEFPTYGNIPIQPPGPVAPLTFSAWDELFSKYVANEPGAPAPNNIDWGYFFTGTTIGCSNEIASPCDEPDLEWMNHVNGGFNQIGYETDSAPSRRARIQSYDPGHPSATVWTTPESGWRQLQFNYDDANLRYSWQTRNENSYAPLAGPAQLAAPKVAATPSGASPPAPSLGRAALVSTSALALFLLVYFLPLLKWAGASLQVALPGYAKLHKSDVLNNKVRETMVQAIRADPGITPPQLQELTGAGWSTVVYHLGVLEKNKLVSSLIDGRHKRFFPYENVNWSDRGRIAVLKNEQSRHLYEMILQEPGVGPSDLSSRVGVSRSTIYWHVERLEKAGLVGRDRQRLKTVFFANPPAVGTPYDPKNAVEVS